MRSLARLTCTCVALFVVAQLAGCATTTRVDPLTPKLAARAGPCDVNVIDKGGLVPAGHAAIARIESHIKRNVFFGGRVTLFDEAYKELRGKACEVGGDQVQVDDFMESAAGEMTHVHVWATVFRRD
jgi:hypothetical protein